MMKIVWSLICIQYFGSINKMNLKFCTPVALLIHSAVVQSLVCLSLVRSCVVDPNSLNPVPDPVPGQGFDDQKFKKYGTAEKIISFLIKKNAIYLSLGLLKGRQSYRRSLQPSKENLQ
jgi:hypothetical protein